MIKKTTLCLQNFLYFFVTCIVISAPALYNRFPLIFSDSALYITNSFNLAPLVDRPIGYAYFIRLFSMKFSLWPVIFAQAAIVSILLYMVIQSWFTSFNSNKIKVIHFAVVVFLSTFTGMSWATAQIMPDIFSALSILCFLLFMNHASIISIRSIFLLTLIFLFCISHFSNSAILLLLSIFYCFFILYHKKLFFLKLQFKKLGLIIGTIAFAYLTIMFLNYRHYNEFTISRSSHVFLMARLIEMGIIDTYLKENCATNKFKICEYCNELPRTANDFIWSSNSPFNRMGGWEQTRNEYNVIIKDIMTSPRYLKTYFWESIKGTFNQLLNTRIGDGIVSYNEESGPYKLIKEYMQNNEIKREFISSEQYWERLDFDLINKIFFILLGLSATIIVFSIYLHKLDILKSTQIYIICTGILANAMISANLSNVVHRYQARISWMLVFISLVIVINYYIENRKSKNNRYQNSSTL